MKKGIIKKKKAPEKWKYISELMLGILAFLMGFEALIELIGYYKIIGFEYAYTCSFALAYPSWLFSLGMLIVGTFLVINSLMRLFNKTKST